MYLPSEKWAFALGFPRTGVVFKPNRVTNLFVAGEYTNGEYRLHDSSIGADIISYRDFRALAGINIRIHHASSWGYPADMRFPGNSNSMREPEMM